METVAAGTGDQLGFSSELLQKLACNHHVQQFCQINKSTYMYLEHVLLIYIRCCSLCYWFCKRNIAVVRFNKKFIPVFVLLWPKCGLNSSLLLRKGNIKRKQKESEENYATPQHKRFRSILITVILILKFPDHRSFRALHNKTNVLPLTA